MGKEKDFWDLIDENTEFEIELDGEKKEIELEELLEDEKISEGKGKNKGKSIVRYRAKPDMQVINTGQAFVNAIFTFIRAIFGLGYSGSSFFEAITRQGKNAVVNLKNAFEVEVNTKFGKMKLWHLLLILGGIGLITYGVVSWSKER